MRARLFRINAMAMVSFKSDPIAGLVVRHNVEERNRGMIMNFIETCSRLDAVSGSACGSM